MRSESNLWVWNGHKRHNNTYVESSYKNTEHQQWFFFLWGQKCTKTLKCSKVKCQSYLCYYYYKQYLKQTLHTNQLLDMTGHSWFVPNFSLDVITKFFTMTAYEKLWHPATIYNHLKEEKKGKTKWEEAITNIYHTYAIKILKWLGYIKLKRIQHYSKQ